MAPDLNSVPPSPRPLASTPLIASRNPSRRTSTQAAPPQGLQQQPNSPSFNILPSNQSTVNHSQQQTVSPPLASPTMMGGTATTTGIGLMGDNTGVGGGPGPLRHPRPLTAADLHLQLEKEQEAVVNRLTRELSMLRAAQNASVVSNASSTSAGLPDPADHSANHLLSGPSHPAPSQRRHHRSSSSTSTRSIGTPASISTVGGIAGSIAADTPSTTADRHPRGTIPRHDSIPNSHSMSRQNSMTSSRRSGASSPALLSSAQSSYQHTETFPYFHQQRPVLSQHLSAGGHSNANLPSLAQNERETGSRRESITQVPTTGRYEEAAFHRHELEAVKRENDTLKRRIRELERTLRARRPSDASVNAGNIGRVRSESVSTTASQSFRDVVGGMTGAGGASGAGRGREKEDDVVGVGESASTGRLR